ncbi:MAG: hypothetical protein D6776_11945, partial [Planctomycetota bacterium]
PAEPLAELPSAVGPDGVARASWTVAFELHTLPDPELVFEIEQGDDVWISPPLLLEAPLALRCEDVTGAALADWRLEAIDVLGNRLVLRTDAEGRVQTRVAAAPVQLLAEGWRLEGERLPGDREIWPLEPQTLRWIRDRWRVVLTSPRDGELLVAGSALPLEAVIEPLEPGSQPPTAVERWTVSGPARIEERDGRRWLRCEPVPGEVSVVAEAAAVCGRATVRTVRPRLVRLQWLDLEGNLAPLFDHGLGRPAFGYAEFDPDGAPVRSHPAAARMGSRLRLRAWLHFEQPPSRSCSARVALVSQRLRDPRARPPADRSLRDRSLTFRAADGAAITLGPEGAVLDLESDRELPAWIRRHLLRLELRLACDDDALAPEQAPVYGRVRDVELLAVHDTPRLAAGRPQSPGPEPLKKTELDPFHLRRAVAWASGGWHLDPAEPGSEEPDLGGSIPSLLLQRMGPYRSPDEYEGKDGLPAADHPSPVLRTPRRGAGPIPPPAPPGPLEETRRQVRTDHFELHGGTDPISIVLPVVTGATLELAFVRGPEANAVAVSFAVVLDDRPPQTVGPLAAGQRATVRFDPLAPGRHELRIEAQGDAPWTARLTVAATACPWHLRERPEHRWGFEVLDHPLWPGGAQHQAASVAATALAALGVPVRYGWVQARTGGAVVLDTHDPVTRDAPCHDPEIDWGPSLVGFPVLHRPDAPPLAFDHRNARSSPAVALHTTLHAQRPPRPGELIRPSCRCGHPWAPESWTDWGATLRAGVAVRVRLASTISPTLARAGLVPGGAYVVRHAPPDLWLARGPRATGSEPATATRLFRNAARTPLRRALDLWGALLLFDGSGALRDPAAAGGRQDAGRLEPLEIEPFVARDGVVYRTFPLALAAPFERRWHHERRFRLAPFDRRVRVRGGLRLLLSLLEPVAHYTVHVRVLLDRRECTRFVLRGGDTSGWIAVPEVEDGLRRLTVHMLAMGHGPMRAGLHGALTVETGGRRTPPRRCVVCGAQPVWRYGFGDAEHPPLVGSVLTHCPRCAATVHEDDAACWACALRLERHRYAPLAYAPPPSETAPADGEGRS